MNVRIRVLTQTLSDKEAYYITDEKCVRYYSGFSGEGTLLISKHDCILFTDSRYTEAAGKQTDVAVYDIADGLQNGFPADIERVKICEQHITLAQYNRLKALLPNVEFISDAGVILQARMIKDVSELARIKKASAIAETAYENLLDRVRVGVTEKELALEFEWMCRKSGAEGMSFDMIVASGPHSSMPHATVTDRALACGDFITFDFGCVYDGYCSDMTRTVVLGSCSEEQRKVYDTVLCAQLAGLAAVKAGALCSVADAAARDVIVSAGYGRYFGHSLGHGVGMDVHEAPNLSPKSELTLQDGMVVTVEPGIYLPNKFGVRIEDLVVVNGQNCELLTKNSKDLRII